MEVSIRTAPQEFSVNRTMQIGLGEAIRRMIGLHTKATAGIASAEELSERDLLLQSMNAVKMDLGFDCNNDNVPDSIEMFEQAASTSCCRLIDAGDTSRRDTPTKKKGSRR